MKQFLGAIALIALSLAVTTNGFAADTPKKESKQTKSGLYVTALEAYELLKNNPKAVLIDVRDPVEMMFTGWTNDTDIHVPYRIIDRTRITGKKFEFPVNDNFADEVQDKLTELKIDKNAPLLFMCRSGSTRSAPAANIFFDLGYKNSYTIVDGFEGGKIKDGKHKGVRAKDGWRNSGLPWTYTLDAKKVYTLLD